MKKEYNINLSNLEDLRQFYKDITYTITSDVDVINGRYTIDAKSLMGLISISANDVITYIHSDDKKELEVFSEICEKYKVEE